MSKIWVTGIAGFLGSHVADALIVQGHEVSGNDNLICGDANNTNVDFVHADCCDFERMKEELGLFKPDILVHCAATAHEGLSSFSPSFITRNIFEASVSTFSAAIASGVKRIVYMSSMSRYGDQTPPFTEDMPTKPVDCYAIAKVASEEALKNLCRTHNVFWSIAVPHNIIGIRQKYTDPARNVASIMINRCKQGFAPIVYGSGKQQRCFSPVKDCIPSILKMVHGCADGEVINIGPDKGEITINELADIVQGITNNNLVPIHMPDRPNEVHLAYTSSDKARRLLDFIPKQDLKGCLKEMADTIEPQPFDYFFPIEIEKGCPETWLRKLM